MLPMFYFMRVILFTAAVSFQLAHAVDAKDFYTQNGCILFRHKETRVFPGDMCLFFDDGTFISATLTEIRKYNKDKTISWERPGLYHHQINFSHDKKRILALGSEVIIRNTIPERDDLFLVIDVDSGNVLHEKKSEQLLSEAKLAPLALTKYPMLKQLGVQRETSHFNSISEVPENSGNKTPYLKPGTIVVNSKSLGIFFLSPDLKTLLHQIKLLSVSRDHSVHDVQVTKSGEIIFFNNRANDDRVPYPFSAIQKYDPVKKKITFNFSPEPKAFFFSPVRGGVQQINDDLIFFSHVTNGGYLYSTKKKTVEKTVPLLPNDIGNIQKSQQLRLVDVTKFLENSK